MTVSSTTPDKAPSVIDWLLEGDVSIQYQTHRDLLGQDRPDLRARIAREGWGAQFLELRDPKGHWGEAFYQMKWTSTHYTLLDLKNLAIASNLAPVQETIAQVIRTHRGPDGGIVHATDAKKSDVCINGMFLNYASYFGANADDLTSVVEFLMTEHMPDGGWNCQSNRRAIVHSSVHSTLSVLEGIHEYRTNGYRYQLDTLLSAGEQAVEFLLRHRLFKSQRTGEVFDPKLLMLSYPSRWRFDILRALDYFQQAGVDYDERMQDALDVLLQKRRKDGTWPVQARHPGKVHFTMERTGGASRWNTLRAMRVLKHFKQLPVV
ncbi:MAG: hypothetical protein ABJ000_03470 [Saccharospirillum sp.]|uniref:hypothetical protein n=1 Tax=Saccharospirillum sp. TaxID=2033801 RepID=UPI00329A4058